MAELTMDPAQALLHIGAASSEITTGGGDRDAHVVPLALGHAGVPATLFRGDIPTALELENAIAAVEDEVMPAARQLGGVTELVTADAELSALAAAVPADSGVLALERVEHLFDELARVALGGPAAQLPFAPTRALAARLLIVRELMHHARIRTLRCLG